MAFFHLSETIRKTIHLSSLIIPFGYLYILQGRKTLGFLILFAAFIVTMTIELSRFGQKSFKKIFMRFFGLILRKHEWRDFTGATYLIFSGMLCVVFFEPIIAFCAMCFLSIGDTAAAMVGMNLGRRKFIGMKKSLEGSMACFATTFAFGLIFMWDRPVIALFGALAATLAELWNIPVDDNVKIPLISGFVMTLLSIIIP